jgi:hypothetical protein
MAKIAYLFGGELESRIVQKTSNADRGLLLLAISFLKSEKLVQK